MKQHIVNPEVPPDKAWGDVGYAVPPLDDIDRRVISWWWRIVGIVAWIVATFAVAILILAAIAYGAMAHDDGTHANDPLHAWFDSLASGHGLCCSFADGRTIDEPDVDMDGGHYKVRIDGQWIVVPDDALITEPNRYGKAVVWPYVDSDGKTQIRCFMPGAGT